MCLCVSALPGLTEGGCQGELREPAKCGQETLWRRRAEPRHHGMGMPCGAREVVSQGRVGVRAAGKQG